MYIYLLRHGESTSDIEDRYGGDYDDHLTEKGLEESKQLAEKLVNKGIEIIYASPRIRALETADILRERLDCKHEVIQDLRERNSYGVLTGMVKAEAKEKYPDLVEAVKFYGNTIEGAEKYEEFTNRIKKVFEHLTSGPEQTIAIVTHGGPIRCFFREVLKLGEIETLGDCAIINLEKDGDYKIKYVEGILSEARI
ncbi:MAG: histidine phosphatase family protein [Patescibacteria group bacterium]|nr:histidine phosphatase family protein [Patescibacteria group bacterium]